MCVRKSGVLTCFGGAELSAVGILGYAGIIEWRLLRSARYRRYLTCPVYPRIPLGSSFTALDKAIWPRGRRRPMPSHQNLNPKLWELGSSHNGSLKELSPVAMSPGCPSFCPSVTALIALQFCEIPIAFQEFYFRLQLARLVSIASNQRTG